MMNLSDVARVFDNTEFTDVYGQDTFYGQILPFSDSVRSGGSTRRRILETDPATIIPDQRTVITGTQIYLMAQNNDDYYEGSVIRSKYPVLPVDTTFVIGTLGQVLSGTGGTSDVYMAPSRVRRELFEDKSEFSDRYEVFFSSYYSAPAGGILVGGSKYYRVRGASRVDDIGFEVVEATEVSDPISQVDVITKGTALDPVTDLRVPTTITDVDIFTEHITLDFQHEALGFVRLEVGDKAISFLKSQVAIIKVGDKVGDYLVKAVSDNTDFWSVHGRKV